jgi:DNA-3-methyladenine glycosylase II
MTSKALATAIRHLKKDVHLARAIKKHPKPEFERNRDPYQALIRSIVYQQLSGKAASTIHHRFTTIYGGTLPTPAKVLKTPIATLRKAGLSGQKASYLKDLSKKFLDGTINPKLFKEMTDEAIREHVIAVKGIGRWTADMFLMFTLHRPDVLPTGDLGIQKGMKKIFDMKSLPAPRTMERLAEPWRPYRTVACMYVWRVIDEAQTK